MSNFWSEGEIKLLKKLYPIMRVKDLIKYFPKRNRATIATKALNLKLKSAKLWHSQEEELLINKFPSAPKEKLLKLFPRRTWSAIMAHAERLGAKRERRHPRLKVNEDYFNQWSSNMAYILGFIVADGCIVIGTYKGYSDALKFGVQLKDRDILEKIKKELNSEHAISTLRNATHFCITSQKIVDNLKRLGITYQKSLKETVPVVPKKFTKDFIRGVIDGDGGISFDKRHYPTLRLCGGSNTVTFVRNYFWQKFNAYSTIGKRKYSPIAKNFLYNISYRANTAKKLIIYLYGNASLYLERKHELAMKCRNSNIKIRNNQSFIKKHAINSG
jgi:hypothetical protein